MSGEGRYPRRRHSFSASYEDVSSSVTSDDAAGAVDNEPKRAASADHSEKKRHSTPSPLDQYDANKYEKNWLVRYREVKRYFKEHGHFSIKARDRKSQWLGCWMARQRRLRSGKTQGRLYQYQVDLLDQIGFPWEPPRGHPVGNKAYVDNKNGNEADDDYSSSNQDDEEKEGERGDLSDGRSVLENSYASDDDDNDEDEDEEKNAHATSDGTSDHAATTNVYEKRWMENYNQVKQFYEKFGHWRIPETDPRYRLLSKWASRQRGRRKGRPSAGGAMPKHQVELLQKIDFPWNLELMNRTGKRNGENLDVISNKKQRLGSPKGGITKKNTDSSQGKQEGEEMQVLLSTVETTIQGRQWLKQYNNIQKYFKRHGHFTVRTHQDSALYSWARRQRMRHTILKNSKLETEVAKYKLLLLINFDFNGDSAPVMSDTSSGSETPPSEESDEASENEVKRKDNDKNGGEQMQVLLSTVETTFQGRQWLKQYNNIQKYFKRHGHFTVRTHQDSALYWWARRQRMRHTILKNSKLETEVAKYKLLQLINFDFNGDSAPVKRDTSSSSDTPQSEESDEDSENEMKRKNNDKIGREQMQVLLSTVETTIQGRQWLKQYNNIQKYFKRHGHFMVRTQQDSALYSWARRQRMRCTILKSSKLETEVAKYKLLQLINFDFNGDSAPVMSDTSSGSETLPSEESDEASENEMKRKNNDKISGTLADSKWMMHYNDAKEYYSKYRTFAIPHYSEKYKTLRSWIIRQRTNRYTIAEHRRKLLDEMNFDWGLKTTGASSSSNSSTEEEKEDNIQSEEEETDGEHEISLDGVHKDLNGQEAMWCPADKKEDMEAYRDIVNAQIKQKQQELEELEEVSTRINRLLGQIDGQDRIEF